MWGLRRSTAELREAAPDGYDFGSVSARLQSRYLQQIAAPSE